MKYKMISGIQPAVTCSLEKDEAIYAQKGAFAWMDSGIQMTTHIPGPVGYLSRKIRNESILQHKFVAKSSGSVTLTAKRPGVIKGFLISDNNEIVLQRSAFLAAQDSVRMHVFLQKKIRTGLFAGDGFVFEKASGAGYIFAEFDGNIWNRHLEEGEKIIVDTGRLAAFTLSCNIDIKPVSGISNLALGGNGFFHTTITGPGIVWLQTMSFQDYISRQKKGND